jgi:hypothetical protein
MAAKQRHLCAICGKTNPGSRRLHIDHCHTTNKTRDLLCGNCNRGLGYAKDNPNTLRAAACYLRKHTTAATLTTNPQVA